MTESKTTTDYGDGSDGDVNLDFLLDMDRDYHFRNLVLHYGGSIKYNGHKIYVLDTLDTMNVSPDYAHRSIGLPVRQIAEFMDESHKGKS